MGKSVYLDSNGTTHLCDNAAAAILKTQQYANASASSDASKKSKAVLDSASTYLLKHCGVTNETHQCIFTSGGSESNCTFIHMVVDAASVVGKGRVPHVVSSTIEHNSIKQCLKTLKALGRCTYTLVKPNLFTQVLSEQVDAATTPNTCLISIMGANNETGTINDLSDICKIAKAKNIPVHSDLVPLFPRLHVNLGTRDPDATIDDYYVPAEAISISAHKFGGPKGVGALIVSRAFKEAANLRGVISGSQQEQMRGGTENIAGIAGMEAALRWTFKNRVGKNKILRALTKCIAARFRGNGFSVIDYENYISATGYDPILGEDPPVVADLDALSDGISEAYENFIPELERPFIMVYGPPAKHSRWRLPNTLLISIITKNKFCNVDIKKYLEKRKITVSISSACLTKSANASHVVCAVLASPEMKRGTLRISLSDDNTDEECERFSKALIKGIDAQSK